MKVYVTMVVDGRYTCEVEVPENATREDIRAAADRMFSEADFGDLIEIDGKAVSWSNDADEMHYFDIIP